MSVRPHPKYQGTWIIDCRPDGYTGKRVRQEVEVATREEAEDIEKTIMRRHVEDKGPVTARTMAAIFPSYLDYYRANRAASSAKDLQSCWENWLKPFFGKLQPKVLTRQLIEAYKASRVKTGVKHRTVTKEVSYFSAFVNWAAENDYCDPVPFQVKGFGRKQTAPPKPRPLTQDQITAILQMIEPEYRLIYLLMADAGLRVTEAITLQRSSIEFDHGVMFLTGKGNKERIVPITTDRLWQELEKKKGTEGYLSVNPKTQKPYYDIKKALERAAKKAGIEKHVYHHLLRHSFGTNATRANYSQNALQLIMGHSSPHTTAMYQHLAAEDLRREGRKLNDRVKSFCPHGQDMDNLQGQSG